MRWLKRVVCKDNDITYLGRFTVKGDDYKSLIFECCDDSIDADDISFRFSLYDYLLKPSVDHRDVIGLYIEVLDTGYLCVNCYAYNKAELSIIQCFKLVEIKSVPINNYHDIESAVSRLSSKPGTRILMDFQNFLPILSGDYKKYNLGYFSSLRLVEKRGYNTATFKDCRNFVDQFAHAYAQGLYDYIYPVDIVHNWDTDFYEFCLNFSSDMSTLYIHTVQLAHGFVEGIQLMRKTYTYEFDKSFDFRVLMGKYAMLRR